MAASHSYHLFVIFVFHFVIAIAFSFSCLCTQPFGGIAFINKRHEWKPIDFAVWYDMILYGVHRFEWISSHFHKQSHTIAAASQPASERTRNIDARKIFLLKQYEWMNGSEWMAYTMCRKYVCGRGGEGGWARGEGAGWHISLTIIIIIIINWTRCAN